MDLRIGIKNHLKTFSQSKSTNDAISKSEDSLTGRSALYLCFKCSSRFANLLMFLSCYWNLLQWGALTSLSVSEELSQMHLYLVSLVGWKSWAKLYNARMVQTVTGMQAPSNSITNCQGSSAGKRQNVQMRNYVSCAIQYREFLY